MNPPAPLAPAWARLAPRIESLSARILAPVHVDAALLARTAASFHYRPARIAANGSCRLLRTRDGWVALNLPRAEDLELVPALLGAAVGADPWTAIEAAAAQSRTGSFVARARLLGLAASRPGETRPPGPSRLPRSAARPHARWTRAPRVLDLSALWAGPLASALLARAGCEVTKIDGRAQPDRFGTEPRPGVGRLDDGKEVLRLRFDARDDRLRLARLLDGADIVISGMRPRALAALGLDPQRWLGAGAGRLWIAITAYGLRGRQALRVGFGDDCAVAGGLVDETPDGPRFLGDALADPLTGLRATALALESLATRRGGLLDVSLAATAALAATLYRERARVRAC